MQKEGQGDEAGGTNEEKTPKPKKETPPKASATRRPAKKKRQISWDEEKDLRRVLKVSAPSQSEVLIDIQAY